MKTNDNGTDRDMTADEIAYTKQAQKDAQTVFAAMAAAADAKAAALESARTKLAALGLTAEEIAALLG